MSYFRRPRSTHHELAMGPDGLFTARGEVKGVESLEGCTFVLLLNIEVTTFAQPDFCNDIGMSKNMTRVLFVKNP